MNFEEIKNQLTIDLKSAEAKLAEAQNTIQQIYGAMQMLNHIVKLDAEDKANSALAIAPDDIA